MNFNVFARKKKTPEPGSFEALVDSVIASTPTYDTSQILRAQEKMAQRLAAVSSEVDKQFDQLTIDKRALENTSQAFRANIHEHLHGMEVEQARIAEEDRQWRQNGCPTANDVVTMKPLTLAMKRQFGMIGM